MIRRLQGVDLQGKRVDLDPETARGLVDEVDGLVGQEPLGDVAVREGRGREEGGVLDAHAMVDLVALLEATEDADGLVDAGLAHVDGLEASLQGGVLLDVLLVLAEGGGAHAAQLAPGQSGLEHVGGVQGPLRRASADHGVELVDEEDDLAVGVLDLLEDGLQAVLELATVLGAGDQRPEVESDDALVLERLGDVAVHDASREALDDGGLAHAGLANQDRVVLLAAGEDLDHAADIVVPADDRVELALAGLLGEVAAVALEGLEAVLGVGVVDGLAPADLLHDLQQAITGDAGALQCLGGRGLRLDESQQQVLGGDVLVLEGIGLPERLLQDGIEPGGDASVRALGSGEGSEAPVHVDSHTRGVRTQLAQGRRHDPTLLREQELQQVLGRHLRVIALFGVRLGGRQRLLCLHRELIHSHASAHLLI